MQPTGDVEEAGRKRLGLLHPVVKDERPGEALLGRGLQQDARLQGREPCPADLVRAALHAQQSGGLELGAGDVQAHHLVRRADPPADSLGQRQRAAARAEATRPRSSGLCPLPRATRLPRLDE
jgi:hypothetical protein